MSATVRNHVVPWPDPEATRYRALGLWRGESLSQTLAQLAEVHGARIAVVDAKRRLSYLELEARACALACGLQQLGIQAGDAVLVQLPNCATFFEVCFALFRLGALPIMAQPAHRRAELVALAERSRAVAHIVPDVFARCDYRTLSCETRARVPSLRHTIVAGDAGAQVALAELFATHDAHALPSHPAASSIALFQLSGGSTDVPKLIARTHDDYLCSVRASIDATRFSEHTVYLASLPVAHNFPLSSPGALGALLVGGKVVLSESPAPDVAFELVAREQVTVTALVPALVPSWLAAAARRLADLATLSLIQVGGASLSPTLARRVRAELHVQLQQVFGMAEGLVCYTRLDADARAIEGAHCHPMSTYDEVRVVDDADLDVDLGVEGHLLTRGPYTIRGYYDAIEYNRSAFSADGFYRTGDRVRRGADGSLVVAGRAKDQINRGGEKIAAPELEMWLCRHPAVELAALVAVPDPYLGEKSCAYVVCTGSVTSAELIAHLRDCGIADYKLPDRFEFRTQLPKTAVGKIDKRALSAEAGQPARCEMPAAHTPGSAEEHT